MAYQPVWHAGFIWDDDQYVTQNPLLTAPNGLRRIWFSLDSPSQYFPLTYGTFYLERALWGLRPAGYHWVNLLLHAANALLAWRLLARLRVPGAWLAAALFALHPVQVESVAWITERKNVLMGFFFLLTLLAWTRFIDEKTKRPWRFYTLALIFYALALSAKTTACTLPAALLLILWLQKKPVGWRRLGQAAPFVALGIGMGLVTVWWERYHQGTQGKLFEIGPVERVLIASRALWFYAGKLLWPANLTFSYPRWTIPASAPLAYGWLLATAALGVAIWRLRRWAGRSVEVAAVFFAVTLSPVLGFIMLYTFAYSFVADHYQYLACLGPIALAAAGMERGWGRMTKQRPFPGILFCAAFLTALGVLTWHQCGMYADEETLWRTTIVRNPGSWLAQNNLGEIYLHKGEVEKSVAQFRDALKIRPDDADTRFNIGIALGLEGKDEESIAHYRKALEIRPGDTDVRYNLANALVNHGKLDEAIAHYREILKIKPGYADARLNLGAALAKNGQMEEAIAQYQKTLEISPGSAEAHNDLGMALFSQAHVEEAIAQYEKALAIQPNLAVARNNLGHALLRKGDFDGAMACFEKTTAMSPDPLARWLGLGNGFLQKKDWDEAIACFLQANQLSGGGNPMILRTLAAAYAEEGSYGMAAATARHALELATQRKNDALAATLQKEIKLYEAGTPVRDAPR